ncbi:MAG: M20/M25/M40 family metallo-hydrolase, partial [Cyanobacteria bacterium SZAS LIN-2]|nr:M20/M25/M40 family metallo-hydrolase [Cyanobacteria bacterium SZAS LIN-2]
NFKIEISAGATGRDKFDAVRVTSILLQELFSTSNKESENQASTIINAIETATTAPEAACQHVILKGTFNAFNKDARREQMKRIESACEAISSKTATCHLQYLESDAAGQVDAEISEIMRQVACELVGEANVRLVKRKTWTEDFAALLKVVPGSMVLLGGQIPTSRRSHHSPAFDVDESALYVGAAILAATAYRLQKQSQ